MTFDYYQLQAFSTVVREGGFQRAAEKLFVTQSAVSQRIKALENTAGRPLLIRSTPPQPTDLGIQFLSVFSRMEELLKSLVPRGEASTSKLSIGCNTESFELWFNRLLIDFSKRTGVLFDVHLADQDQTLSLLKDAKVLACISAEKGPAQGCFSFPLPELCYCCVASKEFITKNDLSKDRKKKLLGVPTVIYGPQDRIHEKFLCQLFRSKKSPAYLSHTIPSLSGLLEQVEGSSAYAVLPIALVQKGVEQGKLIDLFPSQRLRIPLYWHVVQTEIPILRALTEAVIKTF